MKNKSYLVTCYINGIRKTVGYRCFGLVSLYSMIAPCVKNSKGFKVVDVDTGKSYNKEQLEVSVVQQKLVGIFFSKESLN